MNNCLSINHNWFPSYFLSNTISNFLLNRVCQKVIPIGFSRVYQIWKFVDNNNNNKFVDKSL